MVWPKLVANWTHPIHQHVLGARQQHGLLSLRRAVRVRLYARCKGRAPDRPVDCTAACGKHVCGGTVNATPN